ncbi:MAG TPA: FG-GAP-like repeat-containing protein [Gemmataceae bacterium]
MPARSARRPCAERLEDRLAPSTYYVAPGGSDAADGSASAPWATLQRAADAVAAGDTVIVRAGTYAGFDLSADGTAAAPITFRAEPGVVVNAPNPRTPDGINLEGADYVVVEGFTVTGVPRAGIRSVINHHVTIRNNTADLNGRWGIFTGFSDDLLIENNVTSRSQDEHGIYVSNSGDRPVIRGNLVWGNRANGIHMNGDASQGGDGIISGALVENNVIRGNGTGGGSGINGDGVQDSVFRNNLLYDNHASGISLYRIDGAEGAKNNLVVNNTIVMAADARWALNVRDGSTGNRVFNNILLNRHPRRGSITVSADSLPGFASDFNVVMERFTLDDGDTVLDLSAWRAQTGQDMNSVVAAPGELFLNPDAGDFRLRADSPARDRGTSGSAPAADLAGVSRPQGPGFDIGAYEYPVTPPPPPPPPPGVPPVPPPPGPPAPPGGEPFAVGAGAGGAPEVRLFGPGGEERLALTAFGAGFLGGVRVAAGDVNGDGTPDVIAAAGPGALPEVRAFDGRDGSELFRLLAFEETFAGGVYVAAADLDGDGAADLVLTPDEGGGPRVRVLRGRDRSVIADFFGIEDLGFRGGARAAAGDLSGDGVPDLLVGAGFGGGPRVAAFDGTSLSGVPQKLFADFFVFEQTLRNGVFLTAGDLNGDGFADVTVGGGPGGGPRVFALSGRDLIASGAAVPLANFFAGDVNNRGGVRLAAKDLDGDGRADLLAGAGDGAAPRVSAYRAAEVPADGVPPAHLDFGVFGPALTGGVYVG